MMKGILNMILGMSLFMWSCGTSQSALEKAEKAKKIKEQIFNRNFKFSATYAYPQSHSSIYLSPYYDVKVSPDTVTAYLPYYGRAYRAPMDSSEGGIKFESTDFDYEVEEGRKEGNWHVEIRTNDTRREFIFDFDLWDNGSGRLMVTDPNRQSISFQGDIEERDIKK